MNLKHFFYLIIFIGTGLQAQDKDKYGRPAVVAGINELKVGDQVPDILIGKIVNNDKRSIRTSDYKDKLLVLDFWDTYCTTCIESMPKLDSLEKVFGDRIKILSVTYQSEELITKFFKTNRFLNKHTPPVHRASVVDDRILRSYFPYISNPHVVWVYNGKVIAITGNEYISGENIQTVLDGKLVNWPLKNDSFDLMNPIMRLNALSEEVTESPYYGYSVLTGMSNAMEPEVGGIYFKQDSIRNISRLALFNSSLTEAFQVLLFATRPPITGEDLTRYGFNRGYIPHPTRLALEVKALSRFRNDRQEDQAAWNRKNLICYEIEKHGVVNKMDLARSAAQDLMIRLGLNARYEKRKVKCLVFVKTNKPLTDTLAVEKAGMSVSAIAMLNLDMQQKYPPALDETGFTGRLNMQPTDGTIAGLRKEIQRHGLDLIEAEREIEVIVISDK